jgi:2,4-dienoyl-CoA reductase-like NADH-dependent reductase (Old Yellow Enzyme family)/NADPH-dependent 2,4-dienoyl-CoA reductase/sulfur reductase-like enzyme
MPLERLLAPLELGPVTLPCRIVSTSHQTTLVEDHLPTEEFVAYQGARAAGGAGLIVMEAVAVAPSGLLTAHTLAGYFDSTADGYRRVAAAVQPHGAKLFVQLFHGGREVISSAPRAEVVSASARPSQRFQTEPRALRTEEVEELVASYGRCAGIAAVAGLDGIEVTGAHGYLLEQFFDPELNEREDRYGDPAAFVTEVLRAVRAAAPGLALGLRLSADSPAAQAIAPRVVGLVDFLHLAVGNSATFVRSTGIAPPPPTPRNAAAELTGPFRLGVPVLATTRIVDPAEADALIASGAADAVGMTRALITDPDLPRKVRADEVDSVVRCIGCNACIAHYHAETPIRCSMNPRAGRELTLPPPGAGGAGGREPTPAAPGPGHGAARGPSDGAAPGSGDRAARGPAGAPRRVVIVGAGPAGLAAAAEAGAAGDEVTVFERADRIGGQARLFGAAPGHEETAQALVANYEMLLGHGPGEADRRIATVSLRVDLRLRTEADVEGIAALDPDLVVLAAGARPYAGAPDLGGVPVLGAWDVLAGARPDGRVLVADWGGEPTGLDTAELLAAEGHEVTLVTAAPMPGFSVHQYARHQYLARLERAGVTIASGLELDSAAPDEVRCRSIFAPERKVAFAVDTVVTALGRVPDDALSRALADAAIPHRSVGDCRSPRGLEEAILEGTLAVARRRPAAA